MSVNETDQAAASGMVNLFLMNEFRDLRKGMENRDETLRAAIDGVRESVNVLSAKADRSQGDVDAMRGDMEALRSDVHAVRGDVDEILDERKIEGVKAQSAWSGPRKIINTITIVGAGAGGLWAILNFWPAIAAFLAALV